MEGKSILEQLNKSSDYKVKLTDWEGPMDLLLHLVKSAKIDIKDIFVSQITEQYLEYLKDIESLDIERAAEFVLVAAQLLEMKSKSLLPSMDELMPEENGEKNIMQKLEEYKLFKEASEKLREIEENDRFYRTPDYDVKDAKVVLREMSLPGLLDAFSKLLIKAEIRGQTAAVKSIVLDRFTVAQKRAEIRSLMIEQKQASFFSLFESDYSRSEIINTFLALLELMKEQFLQSVQPSPFSDIMLYLNHEHESEPERAPLT